MKTEVDKIREARISAIKNVDYGSMGYGPRMLEDVIRKENDFMDSLIKAVRKQTYEAIRPERKTSAISDVEPREIAVGRAYGFNDCLAELDKRYQKLIKQDDKE